MLQSKEKKEKYREARSFSYPHASNNAQASQTMQKTSKTMLKASSATPKHPNDAPSITCDAQASTQCPSIKSSLYKVNDSDHNPMTSHHQKHSIPRPMSSTCKNRDTKRNTKFPRQYTVKQSPSSKIKSENRTKVLQDYRKFLLHYVRGEQLSKFK